MTIDDFPFGANLPEKSRLAALLGQFGSISGPTSSGAQSEQAEAANMLSRLRAARANDSTAPIEPWAERVTPCENRWFSEPPPRRTWLLRDSRTEANDGVLPLGKVGLLIAEGGAGKTLALIALAIAVATGTPWLGCYAVATRGRVLAILGEEDFEEVRRRAFNVGSAVRAPVPEPGAIVALPLAGLPCAMIETDARGNASDGAFLLWLRAYVKSNGPFALVVVDPLSRFAGPDAEVDNAAATRFVQACESIATDTGATVLVAHHTNKLARSGGTVTGSGARGSSAFYDGVRWACALTPERHDMGERGALVDLSETVTLAIVKSNYSAKGAPVILRRDPSNGGALLPLDPFEREAVEAARRGAEPRSRRRSERAAEREQRSGLEAAEREQREATARALKSARLASEDRALRAILSSTPEIGVRELRAAMTVHLDGCSHAATDAALARLGPRLRRVPGARGSSLHSLLNGPIREVRL